MAADDLIRRAFTAFAADVALPPPVTLRGANAIDGYAYPEPFDAPVDEPTAAYIEGYGFWGLAYLDARSLRHYLPRLIEYAVRTPGDPAMVVESLVRALRPPDRYPPRLATLTTEQEAVVREFLKRLAFDGIVPGVQEDAQQALQEWWSPNPRSRPGPEAIAAMRAEPMIYREVGVGGYRLQVPTALSGSGVRAIPQEFRRIETFGGYLCGDAHTVVAINVKPIGFRSFDDTVHELRKRFVDPAVPCGAVSVPGGRRALRLDGPMRSASPAEPKDLVAVIVEAAGDIFTLTVDTWPREDVRREVERIVASFRVTNSSRTSDSTELITPVHRDTARLTIRPMTHDDAPFIVELLNDEAFLRYIGDKGVRTLDDARRYIDEGPLASYEKFGFGLDVVCLRPGGTPIGICGLLKRDALPDPDIGFAYLAPYRAAGYGYEAADACLAHARRVLGLRRVLAITSPENTASIRLLEKLRFRFERLHSMGEGKGEVNLFIRSLAE